MIQKAEEKHIYDELFTLDISDYIQNTKERFDLIVSADVFCYINKLNDIFKYILKLLNPSGKFIFTVEKASGNTTQLQSSGRYKHPQKQIEKELKDAGFTNIHTDEVTLRQEKNSDCIGLLFTAEK